MHPNFLQYRRNENIEADGQYPHNSSDLSYMHQQTNKRISNAYSPTVLSLPTTPSGTHNKDFCGGMISDAKFLGAQVPIEYQSNYSYSLASLGKLSLSSVHKQV